MKAIKGTKYITCMQAYNGKTWYIVQKTINGVAYNFGTARTLIEALMIRDWCIVNNWKKRYPKTHSTGEKYIRKVKGYFYVQKVVNGKLEHFGSFKSLEDAIVERDLLIKYNWDLECLCELN